MPLTKKKATANAKTTNKKGKSKVNKNKKKQQNNLPLPMVNLLDYKGLTKDKYAFLEFKNKLGFAELAGLRGKGVGHLTTAQVKSLIASAHQFFCSYVDDLKFIIQSFSADTREQYNAWLKTKTDINQTLLYEKDRQRRSLLQNRLRAVDEQLYRQKIAEEKFPSQEYFVLIYGKTEKNVLDNINDFRRFGEDTAQPFVYQPLSRQKKEQVIFKVNNPHTDY